MGRVGIGIDIGTDSVRVVAGSESKGTFKLKHVAVVPLERAGEPDAAEIAAGLRTALAAGGLKGDVSCGLTGRDVVIRYTQVPPVPDWQLRQLMEFEIQEMAAQSGEPLAADFNVVPVQSEGGGDDTVLLALAKPGVLDGHLQALALAGVGIHAFTPNAIALFNAWRKSGDTAGTVLLLNLGARNSDVVVARDGDLVFARNLSGGGDLFDDALVASFNVSSEKARRLKVELANVAPTDAAKRSAQEEKVARALAGATGQILSMVQSSLMFAKSQTGVAGLAVDKVLLCGGGALLRGLDRYLSANLNVPVERFDPFAAVDTSAVDDALDEETRAKAAVALGLALGRASAGVYSIEILPAALKKTRAFKERTLFAALALVLVLGYLGWDAYSAKQNYDKLTGQVRQLKGELDSRNRRLKSYEELVAERAAAGLKLSQLEERQLIGASVARTGVLLQKYLPPDLYVRSIAQARLQDPELGLATAARPVIVVKGEGREGAEGLELLFNRFASDVGADPLLGRPAKAALSPAGAKKPFEWTLYLNFARLEPLEEGAP